MSVRAPAGSPRRRALLAMPGALWLTACANPAPSRSTAHIDPDTRESSLENCHPEKLFAGTNVLLLGELHDHAGLHARRIELLRKAVAQGWRPALVMEQFDSERQPDIDRARREQPGNSLHLIRSASSETAGWDWRHYHPVIDLALEAGLPLLAGNLSRARARQLVSTDFDLVLGEDTARELGLKDDLPQRLQDSHEREVAQAHGSMFPPRLVPGMARAQMARDALMAAQVRAAARDGRGVVLLAGNGHVRKDIGVARWLEGRINSALWSVGFLLATDEAAVASEIKTEPDARYHAVIYDRAGPTRLYCRTAPLPGTGRRSTSSTLA